jgi:hypothetical protein
MRHAISTKAAVCASFRNWRKQRLARRTDEAETSSDLIELVVIASTKFEKAVSNPIDVLVGEQEEMNLHWEDHMLIVSWDQLLHAQRNIHPRCHENCSLSFDEDDDLCGLRLRLYDGKASAMSCGTNTCYDREKTHWHLISGKAEIMTKRMDEEVKRWDSEAMEQNIHLQSGVSSRGLIRISEQ